MHAPVEIGTTTKHHVGELTQNTKMKRSYTDVDHGDVRRPFKRADVGIAISEYMSTGLPTVSTRNVHNERVIYPYPTHARRRLSGFN